MTRTDLIVLAPWIAFVVGLAAIGFLLLRSRRASGSWSRPAAGTSGRAQPRGNEMSREERGSQTAMTGEPAAGIRGP